MVFSDVVAARELAQFVQSPPFQHPLELLSCLRSVEGLAKS